MNVDRLASARRRMVERLRKQGIRDPLVLEAMARVPRDLFVPLPLQARAYEDNRLPIGEGQTISQPWTVARMSELLRAKPGEKMLEIGTGSGYQAAVLGAMGLIVYTVERHLSLSRQAADLLKRLGLMSVTVKQFDGSYGWAAMAPYRGILVTAAAPNVPPALLAQLAEDGRLVIPLARHDRPGEQRLVTYHKGNDGAVREEDHGEASFVPLIGKFGYREKPPA
jgi:protein-L-isoaspartate(D-aspartate) O-methyltransferase